MAHADVQIVREGACALDALPDRVIALVDIPPASGTIRVRTTATTRAEIEIAGSAAPPRVIHARDCDTLLEPVAVIVALLMRSLPPPPSPSPRVGAAPVPPPPPTHTSSSSSSSSSSSPTATPMLVMLELGGATQLDEPSLMVLGGVHIRRGRLGLALELAFTPPADRTVAMGELGVSSGRLTLAPCLHGGAFAACGLLSAGWIRGDGEAMGGGIKTLPTSATGGRLEWRPVTARVGLRVFAEARYFTNRVEFLFDDDPLWRSPATELLFGIGGSMRIP